MTVTASPLTAPAASDAVDWRAACRLTDLLPERGACALFDGDQIALFRLWDDQVYAVGNRDPFTGAQVVSRGLVGTRGGRRTVASPLHKQVFDLLTGVCLSDPAVPALPTWPVRVRDGVVEVGL
ncbi:nitrite reductase small subunit NirD [Cryptosporangium aurantiacum]|uniref:Assimilatory nitrite reductase (NAD(P)H) small subunit n=1 Tax=Cryptosporangium aurantiacum TaxID=134849 RepID=A0A1M7QDE2_9ACTN|nr:nitrite reductase small subunit NirD [Cryptosporangium aurantiacum]SHN28872.1 assimilatory nitrite reductase (NAD(P)H) small subunit [Cryptosporangium aurantiacum]